MKKQKNKIKFIHDENIKYDLEDNNYLICSNPTGFDEKYCPSGQYLIRTNLKNERLLYKKFEGIWYFIEHQCSEEYVYFANSDFNLFGTKYTNREWEEFKKLPEEILDKRFKIKLFYYNSFLFNIQTERYFRLQSLKFRKNYE